MRCLFAAVAATAVFSVFAYDVEEKVRPGLSVNF